MGLVDKFKRDITRHRQKAMVLAILLAIMAVMTVRAVLQLSPQEAAGATAVTATVDMTHADTSEGGVDAEERINQSKELWRRLREVRGTDASVAFSFDSSFYMPDPSHKIQLVVPEHVEAGPLAPADNTDAIHRAQVNAINEQSKLLTVKSTTVGNGKPWAIVNQQLLTVGDSINGFKVVAIRSREVEFIKDGITKVINMN